LFKLRTSKSSKSSDAAALVSLRLLMAAQAKNPPFQTFRIGPSAISWPRPHEPRQGPGSLRRQGDRKKPQKNQRFLLAQLHRTALITFVRYTQTNLNKWQKH
jgi:hypothetical protein